MSGIGFLPLNNNQKFFVMCDFLERKQAEIDYGYNFSLRCVQDSDDFGVGLLTLLRGSNIVKKFVSSNKQYPSDSIASEFPKGIFRIERVCVQKYVIDELSKYRLYMYLMTDVDTNYKNIFMIYPEIAAPMYDCRFSKHCDALLLEAKENILNFSQVLRYPILEPLPDNWENEKCHIISDFGDNLLSGTDHINLLTELKKTNVVKYFDNRIERGVIGPWRIERIYQYLQNYIYQSINLDSGKKRVFLIYQATDALVYDPRQVWEHQRLFNEAKKDVLQ